MITVAVIASAIVTAFPAQSKKNKLKGGSSLNAGPPFIVPTQDTLALLNGFWIGYEPYQSIEIKDDSGFVKRYNVKDKKTGSYRDIVKKGKAHVKNGILYIGSHSFSIDRLPLHDTFGITVILNKQKLHGPYIPMVMRAQVTGTTALLFWSQPSYTDSVRVEYRKAGTTRWESKTLGKELNLKLTNLEPGATYEWRALSIVRRVRSQFSSILTFQTN